MQLSHRECSRVGSFPVSDAGESAYHVQVSWPRLKRFPNLSLHVISRRVFHWLRSHHGFQMLLLTLNVLLCVWNMRSKASGEAHLGDEPEARPAPAGLELHSNTSGRQPGAAITVVTSLRTWRSLPGQRRGNAVLYAAVSSWLRFASEVVLIVDEKNACREVDSNFPARVRCMTHDCRSSLGLPIVPCLAATGVSQLKTELMVFANHDIILEGPINDFIEAVARHVGSFAVFGRRFDREPSARERYRMELHAAWGIDYFIMRKQDFPAHQMPPFLIGNWRWDNWLAHYFVRNTSIMDIDATAVIAALHWNAPRKVPAAERPGAVYNDALVPRDLRDDFRDRGRSDNANWVAFGYSDAFVLCRRRPVSATLAQPCVALPREQTLPVG